MRQLLKKISHNTFIVTNLFFGVARRIDYKTLSRYIIGINQMDDLDSILRQASHCLKDILDYRLFAFAVQDGDDLNIWIDPKIYRDSLHKIIHKDFNTSNEFITHFIDNDATGNTQTISFAEEDIVSHVLLNDTCYARLYILPKRKMLTYHADIINIIVKSLGIALKNYMNIKRLQNDVAFDPLTNCYNRREFNRLIEHNIADAVRYKRELALIMLDIDYFKKVNDTYGHQAGDRVLKAAADIILSGIRKGDYLIRYGGEEFVVVLPNTRKANAIELAERLRKRIAESPIAITDQKKVDVTASFGIAAFRPGFDKNRLVKEADEMLYKAKAGGRNMVMPKLKLSRLKQIHFPGHSDISPMEKPAYAGT